MLEKGDLNKLSKPKTSALPMDVQLLRDAHFGVACRETLIAKCSSYFVDHVIDLDRRMLSICNSK